MNPALLRIATTTCDVTTIGVNYNDVDAQWMFVYDIHRTTPVGESSFTFDYVTDTFYEEINSQASGRTIFPLQETCVTTYGTEISYSDWLLVSMFIIFALGLFVSGLFFSNFMKRKK